MLIMVLLSVLSLSRCLCLAKAAFHGRVCTEQAGLGVSKACCAGTSPHRQGQQLVLSVTAQVTLLVLVRVFLTSDQPTGATVFLRRVTTGKEGAAPSAVEQSRDRNSPHL